MNANVPTSITLRTDKEPVLEAIPVLANWARGTLAGLALGMTVVFLIALWLNPYQADGTPMSMETHRQLGLPHCSFYALTGYPCPACGMTTSFALLIRGDLINSLRANWAGTVLGVLGFLFIPWAIASIWWRRTVFIRHVEWTATLVLVGFMTLMMLRWGIVMWIIWLRGGPASL
jgi:hypothetical protein